MCGLKRRSKLISYYIMYVGTTIMSSAGTTEQLENVYVNVNSLRETVHSHASEKCDSYEYK